MCFQILTCAFIMYEDACVVEIICDCFFAGIGSDKNINASNKTYMFCIKEVTKYC